jgi:hypothetical protein
MSAPVFRCACPCVGPCAVHRVSCVCLRALVSECAFLCRYEALSEFCAEPHVRTRKAVHSLFTRIAFDGPPRALRDAALRVAPGGGPLARDAHALHCLGAALAQRPEWDRDDAYWDVAAAIADVEGAPPAFVYDNIALLRKRVTERVGDLVAGIRNEDRRWLTRMATRADALAQTAAAAAREHPASTDAAAAAAAAEELRLWLRRKSVALPAAGWVRDDARA